MLDRLIRLLLAYHGEQWEWSILGIAIREYIVYKEFKNNNKSDNISIFHYYHAPEILIYVNHKILLSSEAYMVTLDIHPSLLGVQLYSITCLPNFKLIIYFLILVLILPFVDVTQV